MLVHQSQEISIQISSDLFNRSLYQENTACTGKNNVLYRRKMESPLCEYQGVAIAITNLINLTQLYHYVFLNDMHVVDARYVMSQFSKNKKRELCQIHSSLMGIGFPLLAHGLKSVYSKWRENVIFFARCSSETRIVPLYIYTFGNVGII